MVRIKYKKIKSDKYKYQLMDSCMIITKFRPVKRIVTDFIELGTDGFLIIKKKYSWDGPSGISIDTETFMRGSLFHDALYQLIDEGHLTTDNRLMADKLLRRVCRDDGMGWFRAWYVYRAVRLFGGMYVKRKVKPA